jgi:hypothetical protein
VLAHVLVGEPDSTSPGHALALSRISLRGVNDRLTRETALALREQ